MSEPAKFENLLSGIKPQFRYSCTECGDVMMAAGTCSACDARREDAEYRRNLFQGCPERYSDARFDLPTLATRVFDSRAIAAAKSSLDAHRVLILLGDAGLGKTTLACAVAAQWIEQTSRPAYFASAFALAAARADSSLGHEPPAVLRAKVVPLLLIDDLGNEPLNPTSSIVETLFARHEQNRRMVVTCGVSRRAVGERYGAGLGRRLFEHACIVEMKRAAT